MEMTMLFTTKHVWLQKDTLTLLDLISQKLLHLSSESNLSIHYSLLLYSTAYTFFMLMPKQNFSMATAISSFMLNSQKDSLTAITVRTVTLGGFNLKRIFGDQKLKNHIFASFSPYRCNPLMIKSSFCRYASSIVACKSTSRSSKFTVGIEAGHDCG